MRNELSSAVPFSVLPFRVEKCIKVNRPEIGLSLRIAPRPKKSGRWAIQREGDVMSKPELIDDFELFRIERDTAMMHFALNELDPFIRSSPCYDKEEGREIVTSAA